MSVSPQAGPIVDDAWRAAWYSPEHGEYFASFLRRYSRRGVRTQCLQFNEGKLLAELARRVRITTIADIGCGAGLYYPLLRALWPNAAYRGFDISPSALQAATRMYPEGTFLQLREPLSRTPEAQTDLVFSRDVVLHQTDPLGFVSELYDISQRHLIMRLRTREHGQTVYDPERSCQYSYGYWIPFIVLNTQELVEFLRSLSPPPSRVVVRCHPVILGGQNGRFLPKELYEPATGTAETAVLVEKGGAVREPVVEVADDPEDHAPSPLYHLARSVARMLKL